MPICTQRVSFSREFSISAKTAEEVNAKLERMLDEVEFQSDVTHEGWYPFEDEKPEESLDENAI